MKLLFLFFTLFSVIFSLDLPIVGEYRSILGGIDIDVTSDTVSVLNDFEIDAQLLEDADIISTEQQESILNWIFEYFDLPSINVENWELEITDLSFSYEFDSGSSITLSNLTVTGSAFARVCVEEQCSNYGGDFSNVNLAALLGESVDACNGIISITIELSDCQVLTLRTNLGEVCQDLSILEIYLNGNYIKSEPIEGCVPDEPEGQDDPLLQYFAEDLFGGFWSFDALYLEFPIVIELNITENHIGFFLPSGVSSLIEYWPPIHKFEFVQLAKRESDVKTNYVTITQVGEAPELLACGNETGLYELEFINCNQFILHVMNDDCAFRSDNLNNVSISRNNDVSCVPESTGDSSSQETKDSSEATGHPPSAETKDSSEEVSSKDSSDSDSATENKETSVDKTTGQTSKEQTSVDKTSNQDNSEDNSEEDNSESSSVTFSTQILSFVFVATLLFGSF